MPGQEKPPKPLRVVFMGTPSFAIPSLEALIKAGHEVVAYGKILPEEVLKIPPAGCINVHASLLPKYRGAGPINRAIIDGEKETGVSIMLLDKGMDTGPVFAKERILIEDTDTAGSLSA